MSEQRTQAPPFTWADLLWWIVREGIGREHIHGCFGMRLQDYRKLHPDLTPAEARERLADYTFGSPD